MRALIGVALATVIAFSVGWGAGAFVSRESPDAAASGGDKPSSAASGTNPYFVEAGQFVVPVVIDGRTTSFVLAHIHLEAAGQTEAEQVRSRLPQVRSILLQGLYDLAGKGFFDGSAVDPAEAARRLKQMTDEQYGPNLVRAVLFDRLLKQDNSRS